MNADQSTRESDIWSEWLLHLRHAGDPEADRVLRAELQSLADRVLDGAALRDGMVLADIGTGDGLIGFRALDRIGGLRVHLTDISAPMLQHTRDIAIQRGVLAQCEFHHGSAEDLQGIGDASVDAVTTRAVLAYVADKPKALREFHRVLKPGGRISIAEPIFQDDALAVTALKNALDALPPGQLDALPPGHQTRFMHLLHRWKAAQYPDDLQKIMTSRIASYSERDLVRFAMECGFVRIRMQLHIDVTPLKPIAFETFLRQSPHPLAPPLNVILEEQFNEEERQVFMEFLRATMADPKTVGVTRIAYLTASRL